MLTRRNLLLTYVACLAAGALPFAARAKGGPGGGGNGKGGGGNGHGGSKGGGGKAGGHGSGGKGSGGAGKGNGNATGTSGGNGSGNGKSKPDAKSPEPARTLSRSIRVRHNNGFQEIVSAGRYQMRDNRGRVIVNRPAVRADYARLRGLTAR